MPARILGLVVVALLGAGCGARREPGPGALPALSPAHLAPSTPPGAGAGSGGPRAAAATVVRAYYRALDGLREEMGTSRLAPLLTAGCPCRAQLRAIHRAIRLDQHYTDHVRVVSLVAHVDRPDLVDVVVSLDVRDGGVVDRRGRRIGRPLTTRNVHRELLVRRLGDRWLIGQVIAV